MKLASVEKITKLEPIAGADLIEKATVLGWPVVVRKGEFNVGDKVCYIRIDTVAPELPEYEFLRKRKFRVRTIKLREQVSQGLIMPLPKWQKSKNFCWDVGEDITKVIDIRKYEKPENDPPGKYEKPRKPKIWYKKWVYLFKYNYLYKVFPKLKKLRRSPFPKHLVGITDEENIQNIPEVLTTHKGKLFSVSYKLNGSSITIIHQKIFNGHKFRICSRKFELHDKQNDWYGVFISTGFKYEVLKLVRYYNTNDIIVQGEAIGKFNGNMHNLPTGQIRLFNIYVNGKRINQKEFVVVCLANNIPFCPVYKEITLNHTLPEILKESEIRDFINPNTDAEGLVWRCVEDGLSFKVVNNRYLLKNNE